MSAIGIIPARMASSRFPGKPLAPIHGVPMVGHVYFRCKMSRALDAVYIATCDEEIRRYAESIGAPCIMTSDKHERASDRAAEAMLKIEAASGRRAEIVVMIQGDEPMITPEMMDLAIAPLDRDPALKVVIDLHDNALYFSREPIPSRRKGAAQVPMLKQVCIIPFRRDYLLEFNALAPTPLEIIESVDMMRILEHGGRVRMVMTETRTLSVDTPADLARVVDLMRGDPLMARYPRALA